jgi:hypothetical protein
MLGARTILAQITRDTFRILTFRKPSAQIATAWPAYLAFGLFFTWLAGIGRYWDSPRAELWQHLGLGSLSYVFVLALILWLVILPLKPARWSYRSVLIFICLTSPPAILYAIPVERFMSIEAAQTANVGFLAIVATWRVALLVWFLRNIANLSRFTVLVAAVLPLTLILVALTLLNLEHVVFNLMAGLEEDQRTGNDTAYFVVFALATFSVMAAPVFLAAYLFLIYRAHVRRGP